MEQRIWNFRSRQEDWKINISAEIKFREEIWSQVYRAAENDWRPAVGSFIKDDAGAKECWGRNSLKNRQNEFTSKKYQNSQCWNAELRERNGRKINFIKNAQRRNKNKKSLRPDFWWSKNLDWDDCPSASGRKRIISQQKLDKNNETEG